MNALLQVFNLTKRYPKAQANAVDSISFSVHEAEILGLLGPNGSGKTTTIQMLLGTLSVSSGSIFYFGQDFIKNRSSLLQSISYASAYTSLPWLLTIRENLEIFGRFYNLAPQESQKRYLPLLERFGMLNKLQAKVSSLSAGQITRLMLIKAFFIEPKIILLDEPTASLDPDIANEICQFILEERERRNLAILFTSHKMDEATEICDRVIFLKNGSIIANDSLKRLAETVSPFKVRLMIIDKMDELIALLEQSSFSYKVEHHTIDIALPEPAIPTFLSNMIERNITYSRISIEEPSLEDYFLHIAKRPA